MSRPCRLRPVLDAVGEPDDNTRLTGSGLDHAGPERLSTRITGTMQDVLIKLRDEIADTQLAVDTLKLWRAYEALRDLYGGRSVGKLTRPECLTASVGRPIERGSVNAGRLGIILVPSRR